MFVAFSAGFGGAREVFAGAGGGAALRPVRLPRDRPRVRLPLLQQLRLGKARRFPQPLGRCPGGDRAAGQKGQVTFGSAGWGLPQNWHRAVLHRSIQGHHRGGRLQGL